jgi:hypothetical protein
MTNAELRKLQQRAAVLTARYEALLKMEQTPMIQDIIAECIDAIESINRLTTSPQEFRFSFKRGGWNSEYALTQEQALEQAKIRLGAVAQDISEDTIHPVNSPDWKWLLPLFVLD